MRLFRPLTLDEIFAAGNVEKFLRREAYWSESHNPHIEPLRVFSIPGGVDVDLTNQSIDTIRFLKVFAYLRNSGFPIDRNFTIDVPNLINTPRRNYLGETNTADVTLIANVNLPVGDISDHYLHAWARRLKESQSKIIFSIFAGVEVDLMMAPLENYLPLGKPLYDLDATRCHDINNASRWWQSDQWQVVGEASFVNGMAAVLSGRTNMNKAVFRQAARLRLVQSHRPHGFQHRPQDPKHIL
jgi:hypothetical protein